MVGKLVDSSRHVSKRNIQRPISFVRPRFAGGSQNTVKRPIKFLCPRFVSDSASLDRILSLSAHILFLCLSTVVHFLSLSAHILFLSLFTVKTKLGDGGGQ
jgi:hypothetical protein